tara:strand:- start:2180 stop:4753 length:2574 start_codon:yes stop_codon:yes gene_type:complete
MQNKFFIKIILLSFLIIFNNANNVFANDVLIDAQVIDIKEKGNLILASGTVRITDGNRIEISGEKAKYNKINEIIEILGNVTLFDKEKNYLAKSNKVIFDRKKNIIFTFGDTVINLLDNNNNTNLELKGKNSFFDKNKKIIEVDKNVIFKDNLNNYEIFSEKIIYSISKGTIKSLNDTKINYKNEFLISTKDIYFDKNKNTFYTQQKTIISDNFENIFELANLNFNLNENIFKGKEIKLYDKNKNTLELKNGFVDLNSNELIGSDFNFKFDKGIFGNPENDPRLVGRYIITNQSNTIMKKSKFTTCKNIVGQCPSWSISAEEARHIKEKKRVEYKNAWLEIYDVPVIYFPYFFHPDPSVERQSGFLFPQFINSSNLGFSTQIPYFKAIDNDKDLTISPRIYTNNNLFLQTEYRQAFKNSKFITDFSYNKKEDSNSHFFSSLIGDFENSFYEMKVQTISNEDYLKKYQIISPLIKDYSVLESSILYEKFDEDYSFSTSLNIFEDLSKEDNDKYEYLFPNYEFNKDTYLNNSTFDTFNFRSSGNYRKFNTNIDEADIINDFLFVGNNTKQLNNFNTNLNLLVRNINTYGNLSEIYKDDTDYKVLSSLMLDLKYPLFKKTEKKKQFLTPLASLRYSPNKGTNLNSENVFINYQNLFDLDRINNKTVESGGAATLGLEYKNLNQFDTENVKLGLAINLRLDEDKDIPKSSSLGQKTSDLIGYSGINVSENFSLSYNFSIDQDLDETNYSLVTAKYNGKKLKSSFEYLEKSNLIGDESYLTNLTQLEINKSNSIAFETTKNIDKNLTNYYNLIYEYKNDCLEASVVYNKQFYNEDSVNSGQNIFFKISFVPFGTINTPNINE